MNSELLLWLGSVSLRSLCLGASVLVLLWICRVKSASARHALWTAVTAGMLLQVVLNPMLPPLRVRLLRAPVLQPASATLPSFHLTPTVPIVVNPVPVPRAWLPTWTQTACALYTLVALFLLLRLAWGYLLTRRLLRGSDGIEHLGAWESSRISVPVTFASKIFLPVDWREWEPGKLRTVLAHEQAHVRRADWHIALMSRINRCIFWFHPMAWWLERQLETLAENACDDAALLLAEDRAQYAQALLDMARAVKTGQGRWMLAMAKSAQVGRRIDRILDETRPIPGAFGRSGWLAVLACTLPLVLLASCVRLAPAKAKVAAPVNPAPASAPPPPPTAQALPNPPAAPDGTPYQKWLKEEVVYIITDAERNAFQALQTDEEREQFMEQFWLRRDPTPPTVENEFREEHYRRIAYANDRFASARLPGWETDRGMIYIRFGPPDERAQNPGRTYDRPIEEGGGTSTLFPFEKWRYRYIEGFSGEINIEFVDTSRNGEYHLTMDPGDTDKLTHGPRANAPPSPADTNQFTRLQLFAQIQAPPQIQNKDLEAAVDSSIKYNQLPMQISIEYTPVTAATVLARITIHFMAKDLQFKQQIGGSAATLNIYGRVTSMTRRPVASFEGSFPVGDRSGWRQAPIFEKTVPLPHGLFRLNVAAKDVNSGNMTVSETELDVR